MNLLTYFTLWIFSSISNFSLLLPNFPIGGLIGLLWGDILEKGWRWLQAVSILEDKYGDSKFCWVDWYILLTCKVWRYSYLVVHNLFVSGVSYFQIVMCLFISDRISKSSLIVLSLTSQPPPYAFFLWLIRWWLILSGILHYSC